MDKDKTYHSKTDRVSKSGLDWVRKAPKKYHYHYLEKNKPKSKKKESRELVIGTALHMYVLEPERFNSIYEVSPIFTGKGSVEKMNAYIADRPNKVLLSYDEFERVQGMGESIKTHPAALKLLDTGIAEMLNEWEDEDTGVKCKSRMDFYNNKRGVIVDLKTTDDATPDGFNRSVIKYRYHVQDTFYSDGLIANNMPCNGFVFICVEKDPPHLVEVYELDEEYKNEGRMAYKTDLETYKRCKETNVWPGYSPTIELLTPPRWAFYD